MCEGNGSMQTAAGCQRRRKECFGQSAGIYHWMCISQIPCASTEHHNKIKAGRMAAVCQPFLLPEEERGRMGEGGCDGSIDISVSRWLNATADRED